MNHPSLPKPSGLSHQLTVSSVCGVVVVISSVVAPMSILVSVVAPMSVLLEGGIAVLILPPLPFLPALKSSIV